MFIHYEKPSKCEWLEGGLDEFVSHYNRECSRSYSHTECLDVVRAGGATPKAPEVLVTDSATGHRMAIERKAVIWPPKYVPKHKNEHAFASAVWQAIGPRFKDAHYKLTVRSKQMEGLADADYQKIGRHIGLAVTQLSPADLPIERSAPVWWSLCLDDMPFYEEQKGVVVSHVDDELTLEVFDTDEAKLGTVAEMQKQLENASLKFADYSDARRLVLLDFYGTELHEDDIPPILAAISIPAVIDEIWMTVKDWISHDDFQIGYERIFVRP